MSQGYAQWNADAHPWATLCGSAVVAVAVLDLTLRQGIALRTAAAGIERLILSDKERQLHCDAASFLMGYLLGLPCFCYKPNVAETVALLQQQPDTLNAFKQPAAIRAERTGYRSSQKGSQSDSMLRRVVQQLTGPQIVNVNRPSVSEGI